MSSAANYGAGTSSLLLGIHVNGGGVTNATLEVSGPELRERIELGSGDLTAQDSGDICLAGFNSGGVNQWSKAVPGPPEEWIEAILVDYTGDVLLAGACHGGLDFGGAVLPPSPDDSREAFVAKFDPTGNLAGADHVLAAFDSAAFPVAPPPSREARANNPLGEQLLEHIEHGPAPLFRRRGRRYTVRVYMPTDGAWKHRPLEARS